MASDHATRDADAIEQQLDAVLAARRGLHDELLSAPQEAATFWIDTSNAPDILEVERRLQLLERATEKLDDSHPLFALNLTPPMRPLEGVYPSGAPAERKACGAHTSGQQRAGNKGAGVYDGRCWDSTIITWLLDRGLSLHCHIDY